MTKIITAETLKKWDACQPGFDRFCELFPSGANLNDAINGLVEDGHDDWAYWLFKHAKNDKDFIDQAAGCYRNSGNSNSGYRNSGNRNSGDYNSGYRNSGNSNSGDYNSGHRNSGNSNSGNSNSGYCNSGNRNSGNRNSGDYNSGYYNSGNNNSGYFNSKTPEDILVFNKPCKRSVWENAVKPDFLLFTLTYWVPVYEMTEKEIAGDPVCVVRGGQLRRRDYKEAFKLSWDNADPEDRIKVKDLPNFDADVFFEISGIRVED